MRETRMFRTWIDKMGETQLSYSPQPLKLLGINKIEYPAVLRAQVDQIMNRITKNLTSSRFVRLARRHGFRSVHNTCPYHRNLALSTAPHNGGKRKILHRPTGACAERLFPWQETTFHAIWQGATCRYPSHCFLSFSFMGTYFSVRYSRSLEIMASTSILKPLEIIFFISRCQGRLLANQG